MKPVAIVASLLLGLVLVAGWVVAASSAAVQGWEAPINKDGEAYELNRDPVGFLWLSDYGAGEVWQINPTNSAYTIYSNIAGATDARSDGAGGFWWSDFAQARIGHLPHGQTTADIWPLVGIGFSGLYGNALDDGGRFWALDAAGPYLYSLDPLDDELCTYEIPSAGTAIYLATDGHNLYFGNENKAFFYRLDPGKGQIVQWTLPAGSSVGGLAVDSNRHIWFADWGRDVLARLEPQDNALTSYAMPADTSPVMVQAAGYNLWYSEDFSGTAGLLQPDEAMGSTTIRSRTTSAISPTCDTLTPVTQAVPASNGVLVWETATFTEVNQVQGFTQYDLPSPFLWGVAADGGGAYVVDYGRRTLIHLPELAVDVTACKVEDADGKLATGNDRQPVSGQLVTLLTDGLPDEPPQETGADGCVTWTGLKPESSYSVVEQVQDGWLALAPTSRDFGPAVSGGAYRHTFINSRYARVTACKLEDLDGDLGTANDRKPVKGFPLTLITGGIPANSPQLTGESGCTAWEDLKPGLKYGVAEELPPGWRALTKTTRDFGPAVSGGAYRHTFINSKITEWPVYMPAVHK